MWAAVILYVVGSAVAQVLFQRFAFRHMGATREDLDITIVSMIAGFCWPAFVVMAVLCSPSLIYKKFGGAP